MNRSTLYCCPAYNERGVEIPPPGWMQAPVIFTRHDGTRVERIEKINLTTGDRYVDDPMKLVAFKCGALVCWLPIFVLNFIIFNAVRGVSVITTEVVDSTYAMLERPEKENILNRIKRLGHEIPATLIETIKKLCAAPFYGLAMIGASAYGLVFPYVGREYVAKVESSWRELSPRADILRQHSEVEFLEAMSTVFRKRQAPYTFYLAHCFQPLGNVRDPHIESINGVAIRQFLQLHNFQV